MSIVRLQAGRGLFGDTKLRHAETFDAQVGGDDGPEPIVASEAPPKAVKTHLDVVQNYLAHHGYFAGQGVTLAEHVNEFFLNDPDSMEPTEAIMAGVKKQSDALADKWLAGAVENPLA